MAKTAQYQGHILCKYKIRDRKKRKRKVYQIFVNKMFSKTKLNVSGLKGEVSFQCK